MAVCCSTFCLSAATWVTRGRSGRCVLHRCYKPPLSQTNEIGLLKDRRGVEVTFESTLSDALNRAMMPGFFVCFGFFFQSKQSRVDGLSGVIEFSLGSFGQNLNGFERGGLNF